MVESRTARMRLVHWSSGTDSPQRVDFNETFLSIESLAAIDAQGTLNDRPTPNKTGMYYFATDNGTLYRSDGTTWAVVGASVLSQLVKPARTDAIAQTVQGLASQTADLKRVLNSANVIYQRVRSNGDLIHGPLRVSQAARTANSTETVPTDSAVTLDNGSTGMWGLSALATTGNTAGFFRAVRGGTTVFSVNAAGVVTTPSVVLSSEPTNTNHATTKNYVDTKIGSTVYPLDGPQLSGVLPLVNGGTGGTTEATARSGIGAAASATTIATGAGLSGGGNLTASRTLSVVFPTANTTHHGGNVGTSDVAARYDHSHDLAGEKIIGVLPIANGGTAATTAAGALTSLGAAPVTTTFTAGTGLSGGGTLAANRTFSVDYAGNGTANSAARSDHTHDINSSTVTGTLSVAGGGTGRTTLTSGSYLVGNGTGLPVLRTSAQVLADIDAATSGHGHSLNDANLTGVLGVSQGGTGATSTAAARTALAVPVNTTQVVAGNGLTGGGTLAASRTLNVDFAGTGTANTVARSNHTHSLADSTIIGTLPWAQIPDIELLTSENLDTLTTTKTYLQNTQNNITDISAQNYPVRNAGLLQVFAAVNFVFQFYTSYSPNRQYMRRLYSGAWTAWEEQATVKDIGDLSSVYAPMTHGHRLTDSNLTGTLPVNQGGTGATTQAAARTALAVPSTSIAVTAGAGLSGGGTLAASRTLQVVFEGSGSKNTSARSDHGHALTDANLTGILPVSQGGTGGTTASAARNGIDAAYSAIQIATGAGLNGGGNLMANRTLSAAFPSTSFTLDGVSTGTGNFVARMDHKHSLSGNYLEGNLAWNKAPIPIALSTEDLDTLTETADYHQGSNTNATSARNYPSNVAGKLEVVAASQMVYQTYTDYSSIGSVWRRTRYQSTWYSWKEMSESSHGHKLTDSNITGVLPVTQGGTGRSTITAGTYLRGNGTTTVTMRQPEDVLSDIGGQPRDVETLPSNQNINNWTTTGKWIPSSLANVTTANGYPSEANASVVFLEHTQVSSNYSVQVLTMAYNNRMWRRAMRNGTWYEWYYAPRTPYRVETGGASGWSVRTNGISVVQHDDGSKGCSLEVTMVRTDPVFTQGTSYLVHGYFTPAELRPTHVGGQYFYATVGGVPGQGFINWATGAFSARLPPGSSNVNIGPSSNITFDFSWVVL
ncbi:mucin-22-like [Tenebrio molitor]|uniref:mucin-22-like n=1 Tax=Tenebrio molitor TaxID=7067 RepID=UPI0036249B12